MLRLTHNVTITLRVRFDNMPATPAMHVGGDRGLTVVRPGSPDKEAVPNWLLVNSYRTFLPT